MTNLRKWKKLTHVPHFPTSTVKPKSHGGKTQMSFFREAFVAFFPTWLLNFQIADTCTHCVPIFKDAVKFLTCLDYQHFKTCKEDNTNEFARKCYYLKTFTWFLFRIVDAKMPVRLCEVQWNVFTIWQTERIISNEFF